MQLVLIYVICTGLKQGCFFVPAFFSQSRKREAAQLTRSHVCWLQIAHWRDTHLSISAMGRGRPVSWWRISHEFLYSCLLACSQEEKCVFFLWSSDHDGYPPVNLYITVENHHVQWLNPLYLWPFSKAKCNKLPEGTWIIIDHQPSIIINHQ